jgi:hypothetical protein
MLGSAVTEDGGCGGMKLARRILPPGRSLPDWAPPQLHSLRFQCDIPDHAHRGPEHRQSHARAEAGTIPNNEMVRMADGKTKYTA